MTYQARTPRLRILLVEDDGAVRSFVQDVLELEGYEVEAGAEPIEALALVEAGEQFDLLITDLVMPRMSGHEVAERVRELDPGIPVVHTSGYAAGALSAYDDMIFLRKPFTVAELSATVRRALDGGSPAAA